MSWVFEEPETKNGKIVISKERYSQMLDALVAIAALGVLDESDLHEVKEALDYTNDVARHALEWTYEEKYEYESHSELERMEKILKIYGEENIKLKEEVEKLRNENEMMNIKMERDKGEEEVSPIHVARLETRQDEMQRKFDFVYMIARVLHIYASNNAKVETLSITDESAEIRFSRYHDYQNASELYFYLNDELGGICNHDYEEVANQCLVRFLNKNERGYRIIKKGEKIECVGDRLKKLEAEKRIRELLEKEPDAEFELEACEMSWFEK